MPRGSNSTMTRRNFQLIADVIAALEDSNYRTGISLTKRDVAIAFANALADTNDQFDRTKFLDACGTASKGT